MPTEKEMDAMFAEWVENNEDAYYDAKYAEYLEEHDLLDW